MSRTDRFVSSISLSYLYQAISMGIGVIMAPFLLHQLGQHDYGVWLLGFQVLLYFALLDFGVVALLPRDLAHITGKARLTATMPDLAPVVGQTAKLVLYQMPLVILAAGALWFWLPVNWSPYRGPLGIILFVLVVSFPMRIFGAILEGLQDFTYFGLVNITAFLLSNAVTFLLVLKGFRLYALVISWVCMQVIFILAFACRVRYRFPHALPKFLPPMDRKTFQRFFARGFWVSLNQVAQPLIFGSDVLLVGKVIGAAAVVPYNTTGKLTGVLANQSQILAVSAIPGLSELKTGASKEQIRNVTTALTLGVLLLCGAIVTVVLAVNQGFVTRWLGAAQYGGLLLTALICCSMLFRQWNLILQFVTFCFGQERRITIMLLVDGLVTAMVGFLLIRLFGSVGGPVGSMTGVCLVSLPSNLRALCREAECSTGDLVGPLWPWFWRFAVLAVLAGIASSVWRANTIAQIVVETAIVGLLYCAVMWPVVVRSPLSVYLQRIGSRISPRFAGALFARPVMR